MLTARLRNALGASAVVLGLVGVTVASVSPATAADKAYAWTKAAHWGPKANDGSGYFQPEGEIFGVRDNREDGRGVVLEWSITSGGSGEGQLWNTSGYSTSYKTFDKSFPEGAVVHFHVCLTNNGTIYADTCGAYADVVA
ncbi:hypothetical protein ACM01_18470 [Streptomyces viridochromogenes]|uniref:Secreted protein n=1 Tax=Streptomyces viridochromogenes TaxID=1938 RepID=A0A0J8C6H8_STRVR|nr:hypothetical protein [Streptomyces viridochromogenes]KMS73475.1 hypothetical protein ACM01_18470 [Streptomyces viridochromogenes]KOG20756.1 hypothetical protein ADK36_16250 [Streptomyces viridochromogenes]KOG21469.1 hypothetical protein ADK35_16065 [Streptomyces viridochromogenes]